MYVKAENSVSVFEEPLTLFPSFNVLTITVCFCRRNQNYTNILRFLNLGDKKLNPFDITHQFTHLFWLGDLNYRVEFPSTVSLCSWQFAT